MWHYKPVFMALFNAVISIATTCILLATQATLEADTQRSPGHKIKHYATQFDIIKHRDVFYL